MKDYSEYIGKKYNHLTITGFTKKPNLRRGGFITYAICNCDCGTKGYEGRFSEIKTSSKKAIKSCGCLKTKHSESQIESLRNQYKDKIINHLIIKDVVLKKVKNIFQIYAVCDCDCGNKGKLILLSEIVNSRIKSCGCGRNYQTKRLSEIGKKYNRLTVKDVYLKEILVSKSTGKKTLKAFALCDCDCGTQNFEAQLQSIKDGRTSSCGCLIHDINGATYKDLKGQKFGFWTVIKDTGKRYVNGSIIWLCECSCKYKTRKEVDSGTLISGESTSCGCLMTNGTNLSIWKSKLSGNLNKNNTTGVNGVWYSNKLKKYVAEIRFQNHKIHLGVFNTIGEAYVARKEANEKYVLPLMEKKFSFEEIKQMIKAERHQRAIPKKIVYSDSHGINTMDIEIAKDLKSIKKEYVK